MAAPTINACCGAPTAGLPLPASGWLPPSMRRAYRNTPCPGFGFDLKMIERQKVTYYWGQQEWNADNDGGGSVVCSPCPEDRPSEFYKVRTEFGSQTGYSSGPNYYGTTKVTTTYSSTSYETEVEHTGDGSSISCFGDSPTCIPKTEEGTSVRSGHIEGGGFSCSATDTLSDALTPTELDESTSWVEIGGPWSDYPGDWIGGVTEPEVRHLDRRGVCSGNYIREELRLAVKLKPDIGMCYPVNVCAGEISVNLKAVFNVYSKDYAGVETFVGEQEEEFTIYSLTSTINDDTWSAWSDVLEVAPEEGLRLEFVRVEIVE